MQIKKADTEWTYKFFSFKVYMYTCNNIFMNINYSFTRLIIKLNSFRFWNRQVQQNGLKHHEIADAVCLLPFMNLSNVCLNHLTLFKPRYILNNVLRIIRSLVCINNRSRSYHGRSNIVSCRLMTHMHSFFYR